MRRTFFVMLISIGMGQALAQNKKYPTVVSVIEIQAPVEESFEYIVPVDLAHIFKRYKNLPAIDSTSNEALWYSPGMQRRVYFEDGTSAQEHLLTVVPHESFSYEIRDFTSPLRKLAKRIEGKWIFTETELGTSHIEWTYTIVPKNFLARLAINVFVKKNIEGLLSNALLILKNDLESGVRYQPKSTK